MPGQGKRHRIPGNSTVFRLVVAGVETEAGLVSTPLPLLRLIMRHPGEQRWCPGLGARVSRAAGNRSINIGAEDLAAVPAA